MNKWIAEFELEDGDTMPEHMDLEYKGAKIDFHCRPKEPILDKIRAEIEQFAKNPDFGDLSLGASCGAMKAIEIINKYKAESEDKE